MCIQANKVPFFGAVLMQKICAEWCVSISQLKKNPCAVMKSAQGSAVAVLNRNRVMGYLISAQVFEAMIERLADVERADLVTVRGQDL